MTESEAFFALNMVPDMGAATVRAGIALFGSAAAFFEAGATRLADVSVIGPRRAVEGCGNRADEQQPFESRWCHA